ncbi:MULTISPECIES: acetyl/propionyl/methylcrotonyl-CoA carboxylase subunit alpha [unclassified Streptomyces]|uniref:acetyl-CoA carboxylase biotin carboxylase subunit n=1 Tax=unclassified Streptomyces TaxID=2593676 RepID=UPI000DDBF4CA|nr:MULTISPECIES: acetyl-CoA carboxylase biotin carboxylase subunit [unclassified Streptomyces]QZZ26207.1 acetyl-CoA carboxylase biotin carboxylase subunit [Streptomyces sp. ST1015]
MFDTILVANRGEIALREIRACKELGIRSVLAHSTRDADSLPARLADETVCIGPPPAKQSYLNAAVILQAALNTGAQAVHPGYGFLSEDADFAEACRSAGIVLIGPPPEVMAELGSKVSARRLMSRSGLPLLPGATEPLDLAAARDLAARIGYPLLIKAAAGGGGRGMGVAWDAGDLAEVFRTTQATAATLFGDARVYAERYLRSARHVEVQILADRHGNVVHLGERDCSMQRRHQKLIEESPAPALPADFVARIREAAVTGARAAGYEGAGTFEFLVEGTEDFYFMEVNCRIQVEHPVTEMVTGIDLVAEQIRIAAGEPLRLRQRDVVLNGAAIECRINAEDPRRNFAPAPGTITELSLPAGPFVRVDTHVHLGCKIAPEYDSMIAKIIAWAPDRDTAIARMRRALGETVVRGDGLHTTAGFLDELIDSPAFRTAAHTTNHIDTLTS